MELAAIVVVVASMAKTSRSRVDQDNLDFYCVFEMVFLNFCN